MNEDYTGGEDTYTFDDEVWTRETILILIYFGAVMVVMCFILYVLWLKTKCYTRLAEHKRKVGRNHKLNPGQRPTKVIGFFHPNCDHGAGGEKVLWQAVQALQKYVEVKTNKFNIQVLIYSASKMKVEDIVMYKVKERFGIELTEVGLYFITLDEGFTKKLDPGYHPYLTLFFQAFAFIRCAIHSQMKMPCDIFVDTMGVGWCFPILKLFFPCKIYAYVHYPIVSSDMLNLVKSGKEQFNNRQTSYLGSCIKGIYYRFLILVYKFCGRYADEVACNSSWTRQHIDSLWSTTGINCRTIFPPCDTEYYTKSIDVCGGRAPVPSPPPPPKEGEEPSKAEKTAAIEEDTVESIMKKKSKRKNLVVSFAQFRPEKDHPLQLNVWAKVLENKSVPKDAKLVLIGAVRGDADQQIVDKLKSQARDLGIQDRVIFEINLPRSQILDIFSIAKVAMHTMRDEHFGIAIVELMASGIITIAHNSAGPKKDIIGSSKQRIGYLADNAEKYTKYVEDSLLNFDSEECVKIRLAARAYVKQKFSLESFNKKFESQIAKMLPNLK